MRKYRLSGSAFAGKSEPLCRFGTAMSFEYFCGQKYYARPAFRGQNFCSLAQAASGSYFFIVKSMQNLVARIFRNSVSSYLQFRETF